MLIKRKNNRDANPKSERKHKRLCDTFWRIYEDIAEVMFMFAKFYYDKKSLTS